MGNLAVVMASPVAVGHVKPLLPIAKHLVERGFTVVWAISGDAQEPPSMWRAQIEALGARLIDLDAIAPFARGTTEEFAGPLLYRRIVGRANDVAAGAAEAIREALDGKRVAFALHDFFALWGYAAMRRLEIENVMTVVSAFPTFLDAIPFGSGYAEDPVYLREVTQLRTDGFGAFEELPRAGMVPRDPSLRIACFTSPHLCPEPPAGVELLGVMREALPQVSNDVPAEHQVLVRDLTAARERGAPVVLLSMGTVVLRMLPRFGAENLAFLKRLYTTLAAAALKSGAVVVASTCDLSAADLGVDDTTLGAPGRVFVMPFVPQPLLFSRGLVDVMLMHGGANTLHETVLAGIPVLVCPGFGDQGPVSHAVAQLGLGTRVESITYPGASDAVSIERAADEILPAMLTSSSSKSNARRFAAMVREDNGLAAFDMALHAWL